MQNTWRTTFGSALLALTLSAVGMPQGAMAQGLSTACSSIASGALNQAVATGVFGTTQTVTGTFNAGETVTGTITTAGNSLLEIGSLATLFSGDTGTLTRSYTFTAAVTLTIAADIQAGSSSGASISVTCGTGSGGGSDLTPGADAGLDALDTARPSTRASALPSRFSPPNRRLTDSEISLLIKLARAQDTLADLRAQRDTFIRTRLGSDPSDEALVFAEAALLQATRSADGQTTRGFELLIRMARTRLESAIAGGFSEGLNDALLDDPAARLLDDVAARSDEIKGRAEDYALLITRIHSQILLVEKLAAEAGQIGAVPTIGSRSETPELSLAGSNPQRLRFSTQGTAVGAQTWLWTDGSLAFLSGDSGRDGRVFHFRLGLVRAIDDVTDAGAYLAFVKGTTSQNTPNTELDSQGFGFGAYVKTDLGHNTMVGVSLYVEKLANDLDQNGVTASFDRRYAALFGEVSRQYSHNGWTVIPAFNFGVIHTERDGFTDSSGTSHAEDENSFSTAGMDLTLARTVDVDWTGVSDLALSGKLSLGYDLDARPDRNFTSGASLENGNFSGALDLGATLTLDNGGALDMRLGHSGLGTHVQATRLNLNYSKDF